MALYGYYTPTLILPKKGLNVRPTVRPTPKSGFLSVEAAGYLLGLFSAPLEVAFAVVIKQKKRPKRAYLLGFGAFLGVLLAPLVYNAYICTRKGIIQGHFMHINVAFCTFCFTCFLGLFYCNYLYFKAF